MNKLLSHRPSYPTPSPDAVFTSNEERIATPRATSRQHQTYAVGIDDDPRDDYIDEKEGEASILLRKVRETIISRFSQSDSERDDADTEKYSVGSSMDGRTSTEAWATPKEESGFGSGFFSERGGKDDDIFGR